VVDHYFPVLDQLGERLDALEEQALSHPGRDSVRQIQEVRHGLLAVRRAIWPLREEVASLLREPAGAITQETTVYFRDTYDHIVQLIELVEIFREIATGLMELQFSGMAQRTNETMRVLTIIATIFIPLSFIASVYGMNFDRESSRWNMPELGWSLGYPFALGLMLAVAVGLLAFFRHKGWLGGRGGDGDSRGTDSAGGR
jgi:magnesium transporter